MRHALHAVVASVIFCLTVGVSLHGASVAGAAAPEIVFEPPKSVVVRQTNGAPARGELLRIDSDQLWLRAINGSEVKLKLERVRSIKTSDETFEFWPADESFDELTERIDKVSGATLTGAGADSTAMRAPRSGQRTPPGRSQDPGKDENDPEQRKERRQRERGQRPFDVEPPSDNAAADDVRSKNEDRIESARSASTAKPDDADAAEQADSSATDTSGAPGTEVLICSNCNEELPLGFKGGDACPHCGKVATYEVEESNPFAAAGGTAAAPQNPFAAPGGVPPTAAMPAVVPAAVPPAGGQGMGLADIPWIGKIGIFAAFVIVGWLIMQRR